MGSLGENLGHQEEWQDGVAPSVSVEIMCG